MVSNRQASSARQRGMSLVEIMVALALGAFITVGIVQMFTANRTTYQVNMGQARLQENARFAIEFMAAPLRAAGAASCARRTPIENGLGIEGGPAGRFDMSRPLEGHHGSGTSWTPALPTAVFGGVTPTPGQDIVLIKYLHTEALDVVSSDSTSLIATEPLAAALYAGSTLLVSDCERAMLFEAGTASVTGGQLVIEHGLGVAPGFGPAATVSIVFSDYFYVAPGAAGTPLSLWRHRSGEGRVELVEGVEELEFSYGIDNSGDRTPNTYSNSITSADDVVTVRIRLRANSVDVVTEGGNVFARDFVQTIAVRNRL